MSSRVVDADGEGRGKEDKRGLPRCMALHFERRESHAASFSLEGGGSEALTAVAKSQFQIKFD